MAYHNNKTFFQILFWKMRFDLLLVQEPEEQLCGLNKVTKQRHYQKKLKQNLYYLFPTNTVFQY